MKLPDQVQSIGATATLVTASGKTYRQPYIHGEGLCSDSSHVITFGLNGEKDIQSLTVKFLSGVTRVIPAPRAKTTIKVN